MPFCCEPGAEAGLYAMLYTHLLATQFCAFFQSWYLQVHKFNSFTVTHPCQDMTMHGDDQ
jgi:hypothetical protein